MNGIENKKTVENHHYQQEHEDSHGHGHRHEDGCCGHGHEHGHGHSHGHGHQHEDGCCGHGHEHGHGHQHEDGCCGHGHRHEHQHLQRPDAFRADGIKFTCLVENLGCANCAAKMESRINELPEVNAATLTFATKQLRVSITPAAAKKEAELIAKFQEICSSIEPEVTVTKQSRRQTGKKALQNQKNPPKKNWPSRQKADLLTIIIGALLFALGEALGQTALGVPLLAPSAFIAAYVILGSRIVLTACKNLIKGQIFDENFLMSLATLGAFAIGEFAEAVGVMLFYRVGEYFEEVAVSRSRSQIMEAVDLRPEVVNLLIEDTIEVIPAEDAHLDDVLLIRPGDRIPLDGVIIEGDSRLDTSPITGEPVPVKAAVGDNVTSGCINTSGQLKIRVAKTLDDSMVTRILDSVENAAASKPRIDRFITRFSRIYTPFVVAAALATAILPSLFTGDWEHWVYTALTFLVISCPCALVLSVPLAFFSGIGAGSKKGILFKGGVSIEALKGVAAVVMDKTGTLTKGDFTVQQIVPAKTPSREHAALIQDADDDAPAHFSEEDLLTLCASCEQRSTHPIAASITAAAKEKGLALEAPEAVEEIAGHGIKAKLSAGTVLVGNHKLMEQFAVTIPENIQPSYGTQILLAVNGSFVGYLLISDTIKPESKNAIGSLKRLNITTAMLTGDAPENADAVAKETGIDEVYARLLPEDKLTKLQQIRSRKGSVMFVGDGINDAPVLAGADVGAAMGNGADAAIEAADVVFMTSNMQAVPQAISIARVTTRIAWQNVVFALAVKALVMALGLTGHASMWMAVFADSGVAMLCVLNSIRALYKN